MPFIRIQLVEGRTPKQKEDAAKEIAAAASKHLGAPLERIHVIFEDMKKYNYAPGGTPLETTK